MNTDARTDERDILDLASLAGHILLENGAEISRVEESMERIASYYGVDSRSFFVLSNGIFTTGASSYAKVEYIPFKGAQLFRVAEVNQICRDIQKGRYSIDEAKAKLMAVRNMRPFSRLVQVLGSAVGSAGFCVIFGGGLTDAAAAFVVGMLLWLFVLLAAGLRISKIVSNIFGSAFATALCIIFHRTGFGVNLGNMIIGSIIPLIPGIPFTNGIRDLADEDYIAGTTRLLDALMIFFWIALGVSVAFIIDKWIEGSIIPLSGTVTDPITSLLPVQVIAAFVGTVGFSVLFGVPSRCILQAGIVGALGWLTYLLLVRYTYLGIPASTFCATLLVASLSRVSASIFRAPATIFMIPGIFPMVPGGGLFWTTYFTVSSQLPQVISYGFLAVKITIAIVLGMVLINEIPARFFHLRRWDIICRTSRDK